MSGGPSSSGGGIGFLGMLAILFIGLRLGNVIDWSWWWVLSPLWIPLAFLLAMATILGIHGLARAGCRPWGSK